MQDCQKEKIIFLCSVSQPFGFAKISENDHKKHSVHICDLSASFITVTANAWRSIRWTQSLQRLFTHPHPHMSKYLADARSQKTQRIHFLLCIITYMQCISASFCLRIIYTFTLHAACSACVHPKKEHPLVLSMLVFVISLRQLYTIPN